MAEFLHISGAAGAWHLCGLQPIQHIAASLLVRADYACICTRLLRILHATYFYRHHSYLLKFASMQQCLPASFSGLKQADAVVDVTAEQRLRQVLVLYHGHLQRRAAEARPACPWA